MVSRPIQTPAILPINNQLTEGLLAGSATDCFFFFTLLFLRVTKIQTPKSAVCVWSRGWGGYVSFLSFFLFFQSSMQNPRENWRTYQTCTIILLKVVPDGKLGLGLGGTRNFGIARLNNPLETGPR